MSDNALPFLNADIISLDGGKVRARRLSLRSSGGIGRQMTQKDLATAAYSSRSYINEIESGKKKPRAGRARLIADALGCEIGDLTQDQA